MKTILKTAAALVISAPLAVFACNGSHGEKQAQAESSTALFSSAQTTASTGATSTAQPTSTDTIAQTTEQ